jgi:hypothetical protein
MTDTTDTTPTWTIFHEARALDFASSEKGMGIRARGSSCMFFRFVASRWKEWMAVEEEPCMFLKKRMAHLENEATSALYRVCDFMHVC